MLCQNCNLNEASIHLYTNVNGNQQQVDLCQNCYKIMKSDPENPLNQFNQTGGSNFFDDFFSDLNNFRSSNGDLPITVRAYQQLSRFWFLKNTFSLKDKPRTN